MTDSLPPFRDYKNTEHGDAPLWRCPNPSCRYWQHQDWIEESKDEDGDNCCWYCEEKFNTQTWESR